MNPLWYIAGALWWGSVVALTLAIFRGAGRDDWPDNVPRYPTPPGRVPRIGRRRTRV